MATKFEIDVSKALVDIGRLTSQIKELGGDLDRLSNETKTSFDFMSERARLAAKDLYFLSDSSGAVGKAYRDMAVLVEQSKNALRTHTDVTLAQEKANQDLVRTEANLKAQMGLVSDETNRANLVNKEKIKGQTQAITATQRLREQTREYVRQLRSLDSVAGQRAASLEMEVRLKKQSVTSSQQRTAALEKERATAAYLQTQEGQEVLRLQESNAATKRAIVDEQRRTSTLDQLRRELEYVKSAEGQQVAMLRQEIKEQQRLATATAETTAARRRSSSISNQFTAGMRAGLMGLRTSIGMYTSSTVVAASAVFALTRALRTGLEAGSEYTAAIQRTVAITGATEGAMASLEERVRSLGATTQFTTSEVAKATNELALVGLTAGQTVEALEPVLNLAIIGGDSVADAAVRATDAMLVFGKSVEDLPEIVNDLAMGVANSSASVDQLTHSLTYAGPPAEALGVSMKDTLAAVETLANAGIRGSRAGTSLRRAFTQLAKPTAEGRKELDKLGVAVFDFNGKALPLVDLLQQMKDGLAGLSQGDQVKAVASIFGVRASSSILALLNNSDKFNQLRTQLEYTDGAAQQMVDTLRDSLHFDFKDLNSAFEAMQINVFKDNEFAIRRWVEQLRQFFQYLGEDMNGGVTRLEYFASKVKDVAVILGTVFAIKKLTQFSDAMDPLRAKLALQARAMLGVATAADKTTLSMKSYTASVAANNVTLKASTAANEGLAATLGASRFAQGAKATVGVLAGVAATAASVVSWVGIAAGVIWGLKSLYDFFVSKTPQNAEDLKARSDAAEASYRDLKKKANDYQEAARLSSLSKSQASTEEDIKNQEAYIKSLRAEAKAFETDASLTDAQRRDNIRAVNVLIGIQVDRLNDLKGTYESVKKQIDEASKSSGSYEKAIKRKMDAEARIKELEDEYGKSAFDWLSAPNAALKEHARLVREAAAAQKEANELSRRGAEGQLDVYSLLQGAQEALVKGMQDIYKESESNSEVTSELLKQQSGLAEQYNALAVRLQHLQKLKEEGVVVDKDGIEISEKVKKSKLGIVRVINDMLRVTKLLHSAEKDYQSDLDSWEEAHKAYEFSQLSDPQKVAALTKQRKELLESQKTFMGMSDSEKRGLSEEALKKYVEGEKDLLSVTNQLDGLTRTHTKSIAAQDKAYQALLDKFDPAIAATRTYAEGMKSVNSALSRHKINSTEASQAESQLALARFQSMKGLDNKTEEERVTWIKEWQKEAEKAATTESARLSIQNQAAQAIANETSWTTNLTEATRQYTQAMDDQLAAYKDQIDLKVNSVGMGQEEAQRYSELIKLEQDKNKEILRLDREHNRAVKSLSKEDYTERKAALDAQYEEEVRKVRETFEAEVQYTEEGYRRMDEARADYVNGIRGGLMDVIEQGKDQAGQMRNAVTGAFSDMSDAIVNFAMTGKISLESFAENFVKAMIKMELSALAAQAASAMLGWMGGGAGGGTYNMNGSYFTGGSFAGGGTYSGPGAVGAFAKGGVFAGSFGDLVNTVGDKPTIVPMAKGAALIREAGPEAVVPLSRGPGGKLGINAYGAGGGGNVYLTVENNGPAQEATVSESTDMNGNKFIKLILKQVDKRMTENAANPSSQFRKTLAATTNLRRQGVSVGG